MAGRSYNVRTCATCQSGGLWLSLSPLGKTTAIFSMRPDYSCRRSISWGSLQRYFLKGQIHIQIKQPNHLFVKNTQWVSPWPQPIQQLQCWVCWWHIYMHSLARFHVSDIFTEKKAALINLLAGGRRQHPIFLQTMVHASKGTPCWPLHSFRWTILISTIHRLSVDWYLPGLGWALVSLPDRFQGTASSLLCLACLSHVRHGAPSGRHFLEL